MSIPAAARRVARHLQSTGQKVVFAESCTGGLVSGSLTKIPGISAHHCGGVVVYRNETKTAYLGISPELLADPGPVSREVAELMAIRVLEKTPEATIAAAVTGHLGPNAPRELDGLVFVAVAQRTSKKPTVTVTEFHCRRRDPRIARQRWVVEQVLRLVVEKLDSLPS